MNRFTLLCRLPAAALLAAAMFAVSQADDLPWPDKNGPTFDGHVPAPHAEGLPLTWRPATGEHVAWKLPLEGRGHSTPVIGAGRLWFTAATEEGTRQYVYAVETATGQVLHHRLLFENAAPEPLGNPMNTYASPSCVLEAAAVYVHFGTYGTARLDPATAATVWQRRDIHCRHFRGPGSSPVLFDDLLILTFDGIDRQFLIALNKETGETVWRTDRSTDFQDAGPDGLPIGEGDYRKAFGTPAVVPVGSSHQVVSVGARAAFGYDARTGQEIWTIPHDDYNAAVRPLWRDGLAILNTGSQDADVLALRLDPTTRGPVLDTHVVWSRDRGNAALPTPVVVGDRLWMVTDGGVLYGIDVKTGEEKAVQRLGGNFVASPVVAGNRLYLCDSRGRTTVVQAGDPPQILARNDLGEMVYASPAVAHGALYLRGFEHLWKLQP